MLDMGYAQGAADSPKGARSASLPTLLISSISSTSSTSSISSTRDKDEYVDVKTGEGDIMEKALVSFLKIRGEIKVNDALKNDRTFKQLNQAKSLKYHIKLAYSLHVGWAIEGAIGSLRKVDPCYVSPDVNLTTRLNDASKEYNVQLLMSNHFVKHLNGQLNAECRPVDRVQVKGIEDPVTLYTYQPPEYPDDMTAQDKTTFTTLWLQAFDQYIDGNWEDCRMSVKQCLAIHRNDGPCQMLLRTIKELGNEPNKPWKGYRELTSAHVEATKARKKVAKTLRQISSIQDHHKEEERKRLEPLGDHELECVRTHLCRAATTPTVKNFKNTITNNKFTGTHALVSGVLNHATQGLQSLLGIGTEQIQKIEQDGVGAIVQEVQALVAAAKGNDKERGQAEKIQEYLDYILHDTCSEKEVPGHGVRDCGRDAACSFEHFMQHENVAQAHLTKAHVLALRLYTTPAFRTINGPLRDQTRSTPHPLPATVYYLREGIKKLRATLKTGEQTTNGAGQKVAGAKHTVLWRGLKRVHLTNQFKDCGGTELAPMSTTSELQVALNYGTCDEGSVLFRICVADQLVHGADLKWVSVFPNDAEVLYPPLTFLRPTKRMQEVNVNGICVTVIEVTPDLSAD
jgi:hypothetical protein